MRAINCDLHKWLVFITCYMVMFLHIGLFFSIGAIFVDVMSTFNTTRAETAVFHSTGVAVGMGSGLLSGMIIHKFGIVLCGIAGASVASIGIITCFFATSTVHMTISFGVVFAFGYRCLHICSVTALSQHFKGKRKLLVLSLQSTGAAFGGMVYPYILTYLSDLYGFRGALLIIGGACMNSIPACLLWKQSIVKESDQCVDVNSDRVKQFQENLQIRVTINDKEIIIEKNKVDPNKHENDIFYMHKFPVLQGGLKTRCVYLQEGNLTKIAPAHSTTGPQTIKQSVKCIMKNSQFMIFLIGCVVAYPSVGLLMIFVADVFRDKGLPLSDVTFGLLLMNIVNIIGRLVPGAMMQTKRIPTLFCPLFASLVATVVLVGISLSTSRGFVIGVLVLSGIPLGMFITMFSVISTKLVGAKNLPTAIGLIFSANCIGNAIAGPVSGYMRDKSGSYSVPFYSAAGMTSFAVLLFLFALVTQTLKKSQRKRSSVFYLTSM